MEGFHVADISQIKCREVLEVDRGVAVGCLRQEFKESRSHAL